MRSVSRPRVKKTRLVFRTAPAPVKAPPGRLTQQAKRAARGFRTAANFISIAYLRLGKLTHLPVSPFVHAAPLAAGSSVHRM